MFQSHPEASHWNTNSCCNSSSSWERVYPTTKFPSLQPCTHVTFFLTLSKLSNLSMLFIQYVPVCQTYVYSHKIMKQNLRIQLNYVYPSILDLCSVATNYVYSLLYSLLHGKKQSMCTILSLDIDLARGPPLKLILYVHLTNIHLIL